MAAVRHGKLSAEEVATYHCDGLVVPDYRVPEALLARMRARLDELIADNPQADPNIMVCPHLNGHGVQAMKGNPEWLEFAKFPAFLDMIEQLIGPDIILWGTTIFGKPAHSGKDIPWHQDADHWPIKPPATITIWIALDPCTSQNGCLRYIPGTHKGPAPHIQLKGDDTAVRLVLDLEAVDESTARQVVLEPGQLSIHHTYIMHGSSPNRSNQRRAALALRYMPATAFFDHANGAQFAERARADAFSEYTTRPIYLLRGTDRTGRNNFQIGH